MCGGAAARQVTWMFQQPACLELTHNHGTEDDPDWQAHSGNAEPKGYGHIGFHGTRALTPAGRPASQQSAAVQFQVVRTQIRCVVSFRVAVQNSLSRAILPG